MNSAVFSLTPDPSPRGRGAKLNTGAAVLPSPSGRGVGGEGNIPENFCFSTYLAHNRNHIDGAGHNSTFQRDGNDTIVSFAYSGRARSP